jgi:hypothetical protein
VKFRRRPRRRAVRNSKVREIKPAPVSDLSAALAEDSLDREVDAALAGQRAVEAAALVEALHRVREAVGALDRAGRMPVARGRICGDCVWTCKR